MSNGKRFDALQWLIEWHAQYWHTISGFRGNSLCRHRGRSLTGGAAQVFDVGWKLLVEAQAERSRYLQTCSKTHPREQYFKDKHFKYYYWVSWNIIQHHKISWSNQQHVYIPQGYWMRHRLSSLKTGLLKFVPESWDMPCWIRACMSSFIFGVAWVPCRSRLRRACCVLSNQLKVFVRSWVQADKVMDKGDNISEVSKTSKRLGLRRHLTNV